MNESPENLLRDRIPRSPDEKREVRIRHAAREAFLRAHREGETSEAGALALVRLHGVSFVFVGVAVITVLWATMAAGGVSSL